jgi:hypothetical protein
MTRRTASRQTEETDRRRQPAPADAEPGSPGTTSGLDPSDRIDRIRREVTTVGDADEHAEAGSRAPMPIGGR